MRTVLTPQSRKMFVPVCEDSNTSTNPITNARKAFEKKRNVTLKQNVNTLLNIANSDLKECSVFLKQLDTLHKAEVDKIFKKMKPDTEEESTALVVEEADDENIFKK